MSSIRTGIAAGGNWIVDRVKIVDRLPGRGMLANIHSESSGTGGAPANVLVNLAKLQAPFPLWGIGVVGDDDSGALIRGICRTHAIDDSGILSTEQAPTSYTDVMSEEDTGDRSFFHHRGANALFGPEHVHVEALSCRIFHLGYLLLLDRMDQPDSRSGTVAASLLRTLQAAGIKTSVDVVSEDSDRFRSIVPPALKHVDYLILNEIEAGRTVGIGVRQPDGSLDGQALVRAVESILELGTMELVVVHMAEGVYLSDRAGNRHARGSLVTPDGFILSALGAGDAFCAGMLLALHEGWDYRQAAELGVCAATACLSHSTATGGAIPMEAALHYARRFPRRPPPVEI